MAALGFAPLLPEQWQSPIITAFYSPAHPDYRFADFYQRLKAQGFVIYPGKVSQADCFRIGNIGDVTRSGCASCSPPWPAPVIGKGTRNDQHAGSGS